METHMQNPGLAPRAPRDCFGWPSLLFCSPFDWRAQLIASRYCLSLSMARQVSRLHFGEGAND